MSPLHLEGSPGSHDHLDTQIQRGDSILVSHIFGPARQKNLGGVSLSMAAKHPETRVRWPGPTPPHPTPLPRPIPPPGMQLRRHLQAKYRGVAPETFGRLMSAPLSRRHNTVWTDIQHSCTILGKTLTLSQNQTSHHGNNTSNHVTALRHD